MMAKIGELLVKIGADASGLVKELRKSEQDVQSFGKNMQAIGGKLKNAGAVMTAAVTVPLVAAGTASFKLAADMEDALGATDQIYKGSSEAVKSWAKGLKTYYGIAQSEALEYSNMMGSLLQNIGGLSEAEAAKMSGSLVELAGDLTAMFGGTTEDAVRALTGALKGNNTMLDNYGMAVNDALVKQKALDMGLIKGKGTMSLQAKQAATLALIMEQSAAAQGQAAREADGASGSMRTFQTEMKNLGTSIGSELLPAITPFISKLNELIKSFSELSPATQKTIIATAGFAAVLGPTMTVVGNMMKMTGGLIKFFIPVAGEASKFAKILQGLTKITASSAGFLTRLGGILLNIATKAGPLVIQFATRLGPMIAGLTSPIGLAVLAVTGLIAIFAKLWQTSPKFRNWVRGIGDSIETFFVKKINWAIDVVNTLIGGLNKVTGWDVPDIGKKVAPSGTQGMGTFQAMQRYASGTNWAKPGLAWVGEQGPEIINFRGGEQVFNASQSRAMVGGQTVEHRGTITHKVETNDGKIVEQIVEQIRTGNRRLPQGVTALPFGY